MGKKNNIIYANPPWRYKVYSKKGEGRRAENHYHTMNIEERRDTGADCGAVREPATDRTVRKAEI